MNNEVVDDAQAIAELINKNKLEEAQALWKDKTKSLKYWECIALRDKIRKLTDEEIQA